jgi:hypothetical protein
MTERPRESGGESTADDAAADVFTRHAPYKRSLDGTAPDGGRANNVLVTAVAVYDPTEHPDEEAMWAADFGERQLVRVDTNYKATRRGEHPVDLSRPDAARLAAAVLEALEDTFHLQPRRRAARGGGRPTAERARRGRLRAREPARARAGRLCARIGVDPDGDGPRSVPFEPVDGGRPDARPFHERRRPT